MKAYCTHVLPYTTLELIELGPTKDINQFPGLQLQMKHKTPDGPQMLILHVRNTKQAGATDMPIIAKMTQDISAAVLDWMKEPAFIERHGVLDPWMDSDWCNNFSALGKPDVLHCAHFVANQVYFDNVSPTAENSLDIFAAAARKVVVIHRTDGSGYAMIVSLGNSGFSFHAEQSPQVLEDAYKHNWVYGKIHAFGKSCPFHLKNRDEYALCLQDYMAIEDLDAVVTRLMDQLREALPDSNPSLLLTSFEPRPL